jgi:hypothetical protein
MAVWMTSEPRDHEIFSSFWPPELVGETSQQLAVDVATRKVKDAEK